MKRFNLYVLLFACFFLGGCWDNKDIEKLSIVLATGFDKGEDTEKGPIKITTQMAIYQNTTEAQPPIKSTYQNFTLEGDSVHEIIRKMSLMLPKAVIPQHQKLLIIGQDLAREVNFQDLLDTIIRDNQSRMSMEVCISMPSAQKMLDVPGKTEMPAERIIETVQNRYRTTGILPMMSLGNLRTNLVNNSSFLLQNLDIQYGQIVFNGAAVVNGREKKLVGILSQEEIQGAGWITGKIKGGLVKVKNKDNKVMVYEIQSVDSRIRVSKKNGRPSYDINVTSTGQISEDWANSSDQNKNLTEVERLTEEKVENMIKATLDKLQTEYRTDALKFSEKFRIQYPREWEKIKPKWDEHFAEADITYDVDIRVTNMGSSMKK
ncbi:Ger(x)C family spore germination protein [Bacillus sp. FJAT-53060]|uniref:Ger(x)C family spore germination protein n=1 Tax=Bacillus sp. FJAT-53060 TaxID=3127666 RepID=UPI003013663C